MNNIYHHNDLTLAAGAPPVMITYLLNCYTWDIDKTQHILYHDFDGHIHEIFYKQS